MSKLKATIPALAATLALATACSPDTNPESSAQAATEAQSTATSPEMVGKITAFVTTTRQRAVTNMIIDNVKDIDSCLELAKISSITGNKHFYGASNVACMYKGETVAAQSCKQGNNCTPVNLGR